MDESRLRALVAAELDALQVALGLSHWEIQVELGPLSRNEPDAAGWVSTARCYSQPDYDRAKIEVDPALLADADAARKVLRHELFHVVLSPFDVYRKHAACAIKPRTPADHQEDVVWGHACEQAVLNLERMYRRLVDRPAPAPARKPKPEPKARPRGRRPEGH